MKKTLLITIITLFSFSGLYAQMADGSTGPDFTLPDINGNSISLYSDFLDQGIPVIMDISATWCGPCWSFHAGHALKDIYMTYGMGGSQEIGVLFVEGDGSTGMAELQGSGNTLGDWVTGTPYPILDQASISSLYDIGYYPTIYGVCPDRTVYEIGAGSAGNLMQQLIQKCSSVTGFTGVTDNAGIGAESKKTCAGEMVIPTASVNNYGLNTITSFTAELFEAGNPTAIDVNNWTGNLAATGNVAIQFNPLTISNTTNYEVVVSSPNGNVDNYPTLNQANFNVDVANTTTESTAIFKLTLDNYGSETTWNIKDGNGAMLAAGGPYTDQTAGTEYTETISLSNDGCYQVTINDSYGDGLLSPGGYSVQAGTLFLFNETGGVSFGNSVIEPFSKSSATAITDRSNTNHLDIYPNPAKDVLTITGNYTSIDIFDVFGKLVLSTKYDQNINVSSLANGIYMLNIITDQGIQNQKITISK